MEIRLSQTSINVWEEDVRSDFRDTFDVIIKSLENRGFKIRNNGEHGKKGRLEFHASCHGRHISIEFYQNIVFDNASGGRYDFSKFEKMPYLIKKQFIREAALLISKIKGFGCSFAKKGIGILDSDNVTLDVLQCLKSENPSEDPLLSFNRRWSLTRFERDESGWPTIKEYNNGQSNIDQEGVTLENGMTRYFRASDGRLRRGKIYTNMNGMWHIVYGPGRSESTWVNSRELFTPKSIEKDRVFTVDKIEGRLEKKLDHLLDKMQYEKAMGVRNALLANNPEYKRS